MPEVFYYKDANLDARSLRTGKLLKGNVRNNPRYCEVDLEENCKVDEYKTKKQLKQEAAKAAKAAKAAAAAAAAAAIPKGLSLNVLPQVAASGRGRKRRMY